jgi:lipoate-protein ligase B
MMHTPRTLSVANLGSVDYGAALALQAAMVSARQREDIGDTLLLLEHPHVFTFGRAADERFLLPERPREVPVYRVSRGGQVTYHGPGQLVGYPILKLEGRGRDVHGYLRNLEAAMIRALTDFEINASRRDRLTGIWVDDRKIGTRKIGSIGVGIKRWVTCHGFALNVSTDLRYFDGIVPCGIDGCEMTSVGALGKSDVSVDEFAMAMRTRFAEVFEYDETVDADATRLWNLAGNESATREGQPHHA